MGNKKENIEQTKQLKFNFDIVEKKSTNYFFDTKVVSINSVKTPSKINSILRQKIYRDIIDNSKSH